jgi:hypothetical protein
LGGTNNRHLQRVALTSLPGLLAIPQTNIQKIETMKLWPTRRTLKRWGIGIAIVLGLLLTANWVMAWRTAARESAVKAAVRAAGDPASIADLKPNPIPNDQNAAAQIASRAGELKPFEQDYIDFLEKTDLGKAYDESAALPTAEQAAAMRKILDKNEAMRVAIDRAAACDAWASVADFSVDHSLFLEQLLKRIQNFRTVMRYARWELDVLAAEGKRDQAVRRGIDMLKLARLHESEPTLVAYLVTVAVRGTAIDGLNKTLAAGPVSAAARRALDAELARADRPDQFADVLRLERAVAMDASLAVAGPVSRLLGWPVKRYFIDAYKMLDETIDLADGPWAEFRKHTKAWRGPDIDTGHGILADLLAPAIAASVEARDRDLALIRSLRVLNALQGFEEREMREASGLKDAGLSSQATTDPITNLPLLTSHGERGWTVYSVGKNEKDDGGNFEKWLDVGVGAGRVE